MVVVMKKLTYGALLSPSEASEEFREGVIKCFRAMLLSLRLCSDNLCSCKQVLGLPELLERKIQQTSVPGASESGECLVAFLQSQDASAAVGHWLSLLLKVHCFLNYSFVFRMINYFILSLVAIFIPIFLYQINVGFVKRLLILRLHVDIEEVGNSVWKLF